MLTRTPTLSALNWNFAWVSNIMMSQKAINPFLTSPAVSSLPLPATKLGTKSHWLWRKSLPPQFSCCQPTLLTGPHQGSSRSSGIAGMSLALSGHHASKLGRSDKLCSYEGSPLWWPSNPHNTPATNTAHFHHALIVSLSTTLMPTFLYLSPRTIWLPLFRKFFLFFPDTAWMPPPPAT